MLIYSNEWFTGAHYIEESGHYPFTVYGVLQYFENCDNNVVISLNGIMSFIGMRETKENLAKLKECIRYLHKKHLIEFYSDIHFKYLTNCNIDRVKGKTLLHIKLINMPDSKFTLIKTSELIAIMSDTDLKASVKAELYVYFCCIMSFFNQTTKVAHPTLDTLNKTAIVGKESTCTTHNRRLKALGILIYDNAGYKNIKSGIATSNTYTRPEFQFELDESIGKKQKNHRSVIFGERLKEITKEKQSISAKLRHRERDYQSFINDNLPPPPSLEMEIKALMTAYKELDEEKLSYTRQIFGK